VRGHARQRVGSKLPKRKRHVPFRQNRRFRVRFQPSASNQDMSPNKREGFRQSTQTFCNGQAPETSPKPFAISLPPEQTNQPTPHISESLPFKVQGGHQLLGLSILVRENEMKRALSFGSSRRRAPALISLLIILHSPRGQKKRRDGGGLGIRRRPHRSREKSRRPSGFRENVDGACASCRRSGGHHF